MTGAADPRPEAGRAGFTLIEVLAVIFLTTLLLGVALDFYVDLSNASTRAAETTRELRRATAILDRVARDLESAMLLTKPPELDPLLHPWVFVAEPRHSEEGADQVKFVSRGRPRLRAEGHESDLSMVAYVLRQSPDEEGYELLRWSSPRLPESLDRDFPYAEDPGIALLAEGIERFGIRFLAEDGVWVDRWDSSQIVDSSELPLAAEIAVALVPDQWDAWDDLAPEPLVHKRRVRIPVRPLDMAALLEAGEEQGVGEAGEEDGDGSGPTVAECVDFDQLDVDLDLATLQQAADAPFSEYRVLFGNSAAVREECR